jgi:hypothetical protein
MPMLTDAPDFDSCEPCTRCGSPQCFCAELEAAEEKRAEAEFDAWTEKPD